MSWQLTHGPIPEGLWVLHRCDNRKCVRPDHLFLGTSLENNRDMYAKGRGRPPVGDVNWIRKSPGAQKGERNFNAHLDALAVLTIKSRLTEGERPGIIASSFGVSVPTICLIANGTNWGHVPWPDGASMSVNCPLAVRSRALRARRLAATGGACAERCGRPADGARERCATCWLVRRRDSKRAHASKGRERKREGSSRWLTLV